LQKALSGRNKKLAAAIAATLTLYGCAITYTKVDVLDTKAGERATAPETWRRFGAYYIADDLILALNDVSSYYMPVAEFTVFKKIRILTPSGAQFATIPVPRFSKDLVKFECNVQGPDGNAASVSQGEIRNKYEESGKVVFPHAGPGSTLTVRMVFQLKQMPPVFENWFTRPIPVLQGRFVAHCDDGIKYSFEARKYGHRVPIESSALDQYGPGTNCWMVRNLEPLDSVPFQQPLSNSEPRISLRIKPWYGKEHRIIDHWPSLARAMSDAIKDRSILGNEGLIRAKAKQIIQGKKGERQCAEAIVAWVQDQIYVSFESKERNIEDVLKTGKSNFMLVGVLCRELLEAAGIHASVVLTRSKAHGGFDPEFVSSFPCGEALVIARIEGKEYCVCPAYTGYPPGAYPYEYFGLSGLDITNEKMRELPPPLWTQSATENRITFDPSADTGLCVMRRTYRQLATLKIKHSLAKMGRDKMHEAVQRILQTYGNRNVLSSFTVEGLGDFDSLLTIACRFRNPNSPVDIEGMRRFDLSSFFPPLFPTIDSTRTRDIVVSTPICHAETLEVLNAGKDRPAIESSPAQVSNLFFGASVKVEQGAAATLFIREVTEHPCDVGRDSLRRIFADIDKINRAAKAAIIVKAHSNPQPR
jgi:hypothetical protein